MSHLQPVVAALELERSALQGQIAATQDRLTKVEAAIGSIRGLLGETTVPQRTGPLVERRAPAKSGPKPDTKQFDSIRNALKGGPLSPGDLARKIDIERNSMRRMVERLIDSGEITATGTTQSRRLALSGRPAKEAP